LILSVQRIFVPTLSGQVIGKIEDRGERSEEREDLDLITGE